MWTLTDKSGKNYILKTNEPFIVGRNQGDLILQGDTSVSRTHAKIIIENGKCILKDTKSKYGTFLIDKNEKEIKKITDDHYIENNDIIRFGLQYNIFTVNKIKKIKYIILISSMKQEEKEELINIANEIDGKIVNEWTNDCTHLTISTTKMTAKLSCSLAACLPIVTINYWRDVKNAINNNLKLPNINDYLPILDDPIFHKSNASLLPNEKRKKLFNNSLFLFFRESQYCTYEKMIKLCGGNCQLVDDKNFDKEIFDNDNTKVILFNNDNYETESFNLAKVEKIQRYLKKKNRRLIPESEIPLSILHASIENFCNSNFSYISLLKQWQEPRVHQSETLVADTQDLRINNDKRNDNLQIIPESLAVETMSQNLQINLKKNEEIENITNRKRLRSTDDNDEIGEKRGKFDLNSEKSMAKCGKLSCIKPREVSKKYENEKNISCKNKDVIEDSEEIMSQKLINIRKVLMSSREKNINITEEVTNENSENESEKNEHFEDENEKNENFADENEKEEDNPVEIFDYQDENIEQNDEMDWDGSNSEKFTKSSREVELEDEFKENETSSPILSFIEDNPFNRELFRPEIFSGKPFGKTFKKQHVVIPTRISFE